MSEKTLIITTAIACIALLEVVAMLTGIDGAYFGIVIAAISGLAGYEIRAVKDKIKPPTT